MSYRGWPEKSTLASTGVWSGSVAPMSIGRGAASVFIVALATATLAACASGEAAVTLPPEGVAPDYQLGEAYPPPAGVGIVVRERTSPPPQDVYSICYLNAFQTQPEELGEWPVDLLLTDDSGVPVFDPDWPGEALLDTSTDDNREAIEERVAPWIQECAAAGFYAVEFENLVGGPACPDASGIYPFTGGGFRAEAPGIGCVSKPDIESPTARAADLQPYGEDIHQPVRQ